MDTRVPPLPMDRATVADFQRHGHDPQDVEALMARVLSYVHYAIPHPPVSADARLSAAAAHDGVDRVSRLPDALLRNIVSRLPVRDAARTSALSRRWRPVWCSAPLVLVDADLLPAGGSAAGQVARADARRVTAAVSRVLAAHPGPFRCVHLTSSYMEEFRGLLNRWLQLLAVKGVQELVLVNRPWPLDVGLPATFFGMATLTRLYLGLWKFPDTAGLPRAVAFPHLRELGLSIVGIENRDMDFVLARSPVLETLCLQAIVLMQRLRLVSRSLRCVQMIASQHEEISVVDAPQLERLIMLSSDAPQLERLIMLSSDCDGSCTRVKIGHAPGLCIIGYLEPGMHVLEVGNTIIKSQKTDEPTGKLNLKFWQESGAIECIQSHMKLMIFRDFRGERSELAFLKFFLESAQVLTKLVIVFAKGTFTWLDEANSKLKTLFVAKWASECCSLLVFESAFTGGDGSWNFERGSNFSLTDPFAIINRATFF